MSTNIDRQRKMAFDACAKAGKAGGLRTGADVLRRLAARPELINERALIAAAEGFEDAALRLDAEVLGVLPPDALGQS